MRPAALLVAGLAPILVPGCGGGGDMVDAGRAVTQAQAPGGGSAPAASPRRGARDIPWEDPEPAEAEKLARGVVEQPFNAGKRSPLSMRISPLVDRSSGLEGFAAALARPEVSLDDRLARMGARVTETEVTIRLAGSVLFDFDKADIRPDAERALADVVEIIRGFPDRPVKVDGHTDSIGSDAYNQALSEKRARAVRDWLAAHGVEKSRMTASGFGESRPVADNATAAGRQANRRVEIVIEK